jgi:hypothetical protein
MIANIIEELVMNRSRKDSEIHAISLLLKSLHEISPLKTLSIFIAAYKKARAASKNYYRIAREMKPLYP